MENKKIKTTLYINRDLLKKIKIMVVNKDKTNVQSVSHAVSVGLEEIAKRGKI